MGAANDVRREVGRLLDVDEELVGARRFDTAALEVARRVRVELLHTHVDDKGYTVPLVPGGGCE